MARTKGVFNFASNFEVLTKAPLDARLVVDTKANLVDPNIWKDGDGNVWVYTGIVVSVIADTSSNNGLYFLLDQDNYTSYDYWLKINTVGDIDASGTPSVTWQLNNGDNGVILKDSSGNLEVVTFDGSTYADIRAGKITVDSIKIDTLNGALYAQDGSIYAIDGGKTLLGYQGYLVGNGTTKDFIVDHSLGTLNQVMSVYDGSTVLYPEFDRGLNTNVIKFYSPPASGVNYDLIILGFK